MFVQHLQPKCVYLGILKHLIPLSAMHEYCHRRIHLLVKNNILKYEMNIISIIVGVLLAKFHSFETDLDSLLM